MHEFDADLAAIAGAQDREDFPHRCGLKTENAVDENGAVHVGFGEAVGRGVEFDVIAGLAQAERVELGFEMAANPVHADQHQRADGIEGGGTGVGGGGGCRSFRLRIRYGGRFIERGRAGGPGSPGGVGQDRFGLIVQSGEECREIWIHRIGGGYPFCVKLCDKLSIRPVHGCCDDVYAGHTEPILC